MMLVLGMLAAGLAAQNVRAQEPEGLPDEPGMLAELGGYDMGEDEASMAHGGMGGGPGMGPGGMGRGMGRSMRGMHRGMGLGPRMIRELNLTPEQQEKMKAAREREQRKAIQTRADIQLARLDLRKLMQADKPDQKAIDAQIDRISGLRTSLEKSHVATMIEFRASLTPDQQRKLKELREQGPPPRERSR
jgi:Spy/CpxP family protein refolding chaperone